MSTTDTPLPVTDHRTVVELAGHPWWAWFAGCDTCGWSGPGPTDELDARGSAAQHHVFVASGVDRVLTDGEVGQVRMLVDSGDPH